MFTIVILLCWLLIIQAEPPMQPMLQTHNDRQAPALNTSIAVNESSLINEIKTDIEHPQKEKLVYGFKAFIIQIITALKEFIKSIIIRISSIFK